MAADDGGDAIVVVGAPALPHLSFRRLRGPSDYPAMVAAFNAGNAANGIEWTTSVEDFARQYAHLTGSDPFRDVLIVEIAGRLVGYSRVERWENQDGTHTYMQSGYLLPAWRDAGIERAVLRHNERHARALATPGAACFLGAIAVDRTRSALLQQEGYAVHWHEYLLVRQHLDDIPNPPLPDGLAIRPVTPDQLRAIWRAEVEAFTGRVVSSEGDEEFARWQQQAHFQPAYWQVAWADGEVTGMVRNFINTGENAAYGRRRGYTEHISVRPPWRRRGLASALLARSLHVLKELGMTEAALGVNSANQTGALALYERMGFAIVTTQSSYRKPLV